MPKKPNTAPADTSREPYIDNYPPLKEWLDKFENARCLWQNRVGGKNGNLMVEAWRIPAPEGPVDVVITVWGNKNGWHIFTEAQTNVTEEYLSDVEQRIGLRAATPPWPSEHES